MSIGTTDCFKIASSAVIYELLGDEIIVANLDSGAYYSLHNSAITIWQQLVAGWRFERIVKAFSDRYALDVASLKNALEAFIAFLCDENLFVASSETQESDSELFWAADYKAPVFEKYTDMKDLLLLDPIHEVDEQGWPMKSVATIN